MSVPSRPSAGHTQQGPIKAAGNGKIIQWKGEGKKQMYVWSAAPVGFGTSRVRFPSCLWRLRGAGRPRGRSAALSGSFVIPAKLCHLLTLTFQWLLIYGNRWGERERRRRPCCQAKGLSERQLFQAAGRGTGTCRQSTRPPGGGRAPGPTEPRGCWAAGSLSPADDSGARWACQAENSQKRGPLDAL